MDLYKQIESLEKNITTQSLASCEKMLAQWYAEKSNLDFRLLKLLANLKFYYESTDAEHSFRNEMISAICKTLRRTADYDMNIRDYPDRVAKWNKDIFAKCDVLRTEEKLPVEENSDKPLDMTIYMVTYNQLELTKLCLDSIFQNTDDVSYELYLIDNGSSDGTYEYFKNDKRIKLIRLQENTGLLLALHIFYEAGLDNGKFWMYMNNDVVVAPRWASNMLTCIKSDPKIASVMPATNRSGAYLSLQAPMSLYDLESVQQFGERFNNSNSKLWQDWVMCYGFTILFRPSFRHKMGYYEDCFYFPFYYSDADITISQTRAGYRTVQARDTYVHHFDGGHTTRQSKRDALAIGEKHFYERYGFFPTDFEQETLPHTVALGFSAGAAAGWASLSHSPGVNPASKVLFLGRSRFHALMQLKSINNVMGNNVQYYAADTMQNVDFKQLDDDVSFEKLDSWYDISTVFEGESFDAIIWIDDIARLRNPGKFLECVCSRLNLNGKLYLQTENIGCLLILNYSIFTKRNSPRDAVRLRKNNILSINETIALIKKAGFTIDMVEEIYFHENYTYVELETIGNYRRLLKGKSDDDYERNMLMPARTIVARKPGIIDTKNTLEAVLYARKAGW